MGGPTQGETSMAQSTEEGAYIACKTSFRQFSRHLCGKRVEEMGGRGQSQSREAVIESGMSKKVEKQGVAADDEQVEILNI